MAIVRSVRARKLLYSQFIFYAAIFLCIIVAPSSLSVNDGLSFFGVHLDTAPLFGAGLLASAWLIYGSTNGVSPSDRKWHQGLLTALRVISVLMVGIVFTPYSVNRLFDWIHTGLGSALFSVQLILAGWICLRLKNDWQNWTLLVVQTAGGVISLIYLAPSHGFLTQGQLIFQIAFSGILLRSLLTE